MSDIGPDNLRKMAEDEMFGLGVAYDGGIHFQDSLRVCADAWERDKRLAYRAGIEAAAKKMDDTFGGADGHTASGDLIRALPDLADEQHGAAGG
jgi:hypothetical protein